MVTTQRFIGQPLPRLEDPRLLRGTGQYTDDWPVPDALWSVFVRSPHAHAVIKRIWFEAACSVPGVHAVLTGREYAGDGHGPIHHIPVPADTVDYRLPAFGPNDPRPPIDEPQPPLAVDHVRYVGEAVAMVIAESAAVAQDAADLVQVDYDILPAVAESADALRPNAPAITPAAPDNLAVEAILGDPAATEAALGAAPIVVERAFRIGRVANAQMEPRAAAGIFDPETESWTLIAGSQGVNRQQTVLASALNVDPAAVRVICPDVGGGFGPRTNLYPEALCVLWASRRVGRPVRWTSTRSEAFLADYAGRDADATARIGLDRGGRLLALSVDLVHNIGAYTGSYVPLSNAARIMSSAYDLPHVTVRVRGALTHTVPTGPYRGAGRPEAMYVLERLLDHAADASGIERAELRRRNLIAPHQLPYVSATGLTYDSGAFQANFDRALEQADWHGFPERRAEAAQRGLLAGIAVSAYVESPVGAPHERVRVTVQSDGYVELLAGTQSTGQGHATVFAQVVADELGITPSSVRLVQGDTDVVASGGGTHSDRSMRLVGSLLLEACAQIRDQAQEFDPDGSQSVFDVARRTTLTAEATFTGRMPAHPTGAAVCELVIDPNTGQLRITRYTCVDDVGQAINPLILHGQVHGGIVQGLGQALSERMRFEPATAQVLSASFLDYALLRADDLPGFDSELVEDPTPSNALRIKGGGESGITPAMPVVVNAALDALRSLGVADLEMPLTASAIWSATENVRTSR
ncbi:MAG: xanthine dehydrogenase family protein molybdopterin-binding subunit [Chloroflexota bacterium]